MSINHTQILQIVHSQIKSQLQAKISNKSISYPNAKDKNYQIALFQLRTLKKVFNVLGGDTELESIASIQIKAQMLEQNIIKLNKKQQELNLCINQLTYSNKEKDQVIEKLEKRIDILNKKSVLFDKLGGKSKFQTIQTQNIAMKQQMNKLKERYLQLKQNYADVEGKLQIHKKINTSQEIQIAELTLQLTEARTQIKTINTQLSNQNNQLHNQKQAQFKQIVKMNKNSLDQTNINLNHNLNNNQKQNQNSSNMITIMSLKQQNMQLKRQNDQLTESMNSQLQEWKVRQRQYAKTLKNIQLSSRFNSSRNNNN